jgi:hypothetical protein
VAAEFRDHKPASALSDASNEIVANFHGVGQHATLVVDEINKLAYRVTSTNGRSRKAAAGVGWMNKK